MPAKDQSGKPPFDSVFVFHSFLSLCELTAAFELEQVPKKQCIQGTENRLWTVDFFSESTRSPSLEPQFGAQI